ncbi:uncharacterized protein LOC141641362 [Silene latifolia]|uniref:uncharacterized protein LOC141641362 n=1 Tax=Silene latifolia TaxID=37657 RepID=UPI003D7851F4
MVLSLSTLIRRWLTLPNWLIKEEGERLLPLMDRIGVWNVRGLNSLTKQNDIKWCLHNANVDLFGLLETRVRPGSLNKVVASFCGGWSYCTNHQCHDGDILTSRQFFATYVYGFNKIEERVPLWNDLIRLTVTNPWIVLGDFNNVLRADEKIGLPVKDAETAPFQSAIDNCGLHDLKSPSSTWVFSRIDRVLVNDEWVTNWPDHYAYFAPEGDYDHCPYFIQCNDVQLKKKRPFKFYNMWTGVSEFKNIVKEGWNHHIHGSLMYRVVKKLKLMKSPLKALNHDLFSDVEKNTAIAHEILLDSQKKLQADPTNKSLMDSEYNIRTSYQMLNKAKVAFLRQKAKCIWAQNGDDNTAIFHKAIRQRQLQNKVVQIHDIHGQLVNAPEGILASI